MTLQLKEAKLTQVEILSKGNGGSEQHISVELQNKYGKVTAAEVTDGSYVVLLEFQGQKQ